jgi:hypothetical protein
LVIGFATSFFFYKLSLALRERVGVRESQIVLSPEKLYDTLRSYDMRFVVNPTPLPLSRRARGLWLPLNEARAALRGQSLTPAPLPEGEGS